MATATQAIVDRAVREERERSVDEAIDRFQRTRTRSLEGASFLEFMRRYTRDEARTLGRDEARTLGAVMPYVYTRDDARTIPLIDPERPTPPRPDPVQAWHDATIAVGWDPAEATAEVRTPAARFDYAPLTSPRFDVVYGSGTIAPQPPPGRGIAWSERLGPSPPEVINVRGLEPAVVAELEQRGYTFDPRERVMRRQGPAQPARPTPPPEPAMAPAPTPGPDDVVDAEYAALVAELGVSSIAIDRVRFLEWMQGSGLYVYAYGEVVGYLDHKYGVPPGRRITPSVRWGWRPLREADRDEDQDRVELNGAVQWSVPPYAKPIPLPVLRTVKAVRDVAPSARFYVSDEMAGERIPDPFLLVLIGEESFVIERWDEPGFGRGGCRATS